MTAVQEGHPVAAASVELAADAWLVLPSAYGPGSFDRLLTIGAAADAVDGWETLCVADTALALGFHDSTVALAALAARTSRARLAVACMSTLGLRNPLVVAQQWANLDALSGGRMTLIACPGNRTGTKHEQELQAFGVEYDDKVSRMEEYVRFLRAVSSTDTLSFEGTHVRARDLRIVPAFVQRPLPIWLTANPGSAAGPATLHRALGRVARLGDGWLTYNIRPQDLGARVELLHELRAEAGRDVHTRIPVAVQVRFNIAATERTAVADATDAWAASSTRGIAAEDLREVFAVGTPAQALDLLHGLVEAGATHIAFSPLGHDPAALVEQAGEWLLPHFHGSGVGPTVGVHPGAVR